MTRTERRARFRKDQIAAVKALRASDRFRAALSEGVHRFRPVTEDDVEEIDPADEKVFRAERKRTRRIAKSLR